MENSKPKSSHLNPKNLLQYHHHHLKPNQAAMIQKSNNLPTNFMIKMFNKLINLFNQNKMIIQSLKILIKNKLTVHKFLKLIKV